MTKLTLALLSALYLSSPAFAATRIEIIFDDSGSMDQRSNSTGNTYCEEAKTAVENLIGQIRSASDIIDTELIVVRPLNQQYLAVKKDPQNFDKLISYVKQLNCPGGTPLAETIDQATVDNAGRFDHLLFVFTDGQVNIDHLAHAINDTVQAKHDKLVDFKFYQVNSEADQYENKSNSNSASMIDILNNTVNKYSSLGRRYTGVKLSDMAQLNDSLKDSMTQIINQELVKKLRLALSGLSSSKDKQNNAERILNRAEQVKLDSNADVLAFIGKIDSLKAEFDKLNRNSDAKTVSAQFVILLEQLRTLTTEGNQKLSLLNSEISSLRNLLEDFSKVNIEIKDAEDQAAKTLAYLLQLEKENPNEFAKLTSTQLSEVNSVKSTLDEVIARSNELRTKANGLESKVADSKKAMENTSKIYSQLRERVSATIATISQKRGQSYEDLLRLQLADKGYTVLKNGEIVYYGTHIFVGGGGSSSGNSNSNVTVRNKGTMILLGESSGGGSGGGTFINEGTIINGITRSAGGGYSVFLNNGQVINISDKEAQNLIAGYFWVKRNNGYLIFSEDLSDTYFITEKTIQLIRNTSSIGSRLLGVAKFVGSMVTGNLAVSGSLILDAAGSARGAALSDGTAGFNLTSRNIQIIKELLKNSWVQITNNKIVISLPKAIIPVVLDIESKTRK